MNKVKSLLLCSAAGLLAAAGAKAADMPQAEPAEYAKVCDTYGVGYWFIPGTDTCLRIGGYVRFELSGHDENVGEDRWAGNPFVIADRDMTGPDGFTRGRFGGANAFADGLPDFRTDTFSTRARGLVNFDASTETSYGTLRSFIQIRGTTNQELSGDEAERSVNPASLEADNPSVELDYAFLQVAGFTVGLAPSFLDFETNGFFGDHVGDWNHDNVLFGYTAQFGNGLSLNVSIESADRADTSAAVFFDSDLIFPVQRPNEPVFFVNSDNQAFYGGREDNEGTRTELPDLTAAFRVDQSWGQAMIGGVVRQIKGRAQDREGFTGVSPSELSPEFTTLPGNDGSAIDISESIDFEKSYTDIGWAVVSGLKVNLPMITEGDSLILRGGYGEGASRYVVQAFDLFQNGLFRAGSRTAVPEAVFSGNFDKTNLILTPLSLDASPNNPSDVNFAAAPAWSAYAGFTHQWNKTLRSHFTASYAGGNFNGASKNVERLLLSGLSVKDTTRLSFDGDDWSVGTATANLIWTPVSNLDVGLEFIYSFRDFDGGAAVVFGIDDNQKINSKGLPANIEGGSDDAFGAIFRIQRNFGS